MILDVADAAPKDDLASMEHSLSIKPDMRELEYEHNGQRLRVIPSGNGVATIMDKDILLYCISKMVHAKNVGEAITPWVKMSAHEVMVATNWHTNDSRCLGLGESDGAGRRGIAFDRWRFEDLGKLLSDEGIELPLVEFVPGFKSYAPAVDAFERAVLDRRMQHGGSPLLRWQAGNVIVETDPIFDLKRL